MAVLVLGLGNILMSDDGFGCKVVETLQRDYRFPDGLRVVEGGTLGLDLLPQLEGVDKLLVIDALQMGAAPGELFRLEGEEVPRAFANKLSVHQMGLQDLLAVAQLQGHLPQQLLVLGVQAESVDVGLEMTPAVYASLPRLVNAVVAELQGWGVALKLVA